MSQTKKEVTIVVEGTPHTWLKDEITYDDVIRLEVANPSPKTTYAVTYRRGQGNKPEGILAPGANVRVKDGMVFHVSETGQS